MTLGSAVFVLTLAISVHANTSRRNGTLLANLDEMDTLDNAGEDFYPKEIRTGLCRACACPQTPRCEAGVSLILDGCGCCRVCAGQLGDGCDRERVCDHHKGLYCDQNNRTCKARPGRSCFVAGKRYENGALFSPSCRLSCSCLNGDVGCFPKCKPPPPGCAYPRLVRSSSNCCGKWRCASRPSEYARREEASSLSFRGSCILQTTPWSPCSKTCDFGVSERVTNDNGACRMTKETRLCIVRPCKPSKHPRKSKRSCRRSMRRTKRVRYSISGCLSTKTYRPRYCGTCRHHDKCCKPSATKTVEIEFRCEEYALTARNATVKAYATRRKMMIIQSCVCGRFCSDNDFFGSSINAVLGGDTSRGK